MRVWNYILDLPHAHVLLLNNFLIKAKRVLNYRSRYSEWRILHLQTIFDLLILIVSFLKSMASQTLIAFWTHSFSVYFI